jgi:hypothetical protein
VHLRGDATDPDGDDLSFEWFYYPEAGGLSMQSGRTGAPLSIDGANTPHASFVVPTNAFKPGTMHFILAVTDTGTPSLTRYRRVVVDVGP